MMENIKELMTRYPHTGKVEWIGARSAKKIPLTKRDSVLVSMEEGIDGDHYKGKSRSRQVTLIQNEHLDAVAKFLRRATVDPSLVRRNIVVSGLNLQSLVDAQIQIGNDLDLEVTGLCRPCSRMEENLGPGGYNAMRGHGGVTARVIRSGKIKIGDDVRAREGMISDETKIPENRSRESRV